MEPTAAMSQTQRSAWHTPRTPAVSSRSPATKGNSVTRSHWADCADKDFTDWCPFVNIQNGSLPCTFNLPNLAMTPRCQSTEDEGSSASLVTTASGDTEDEDDIASGDEQQKPRRRSNRVFRFQLDVVRGNRDRYGLAYVPSGTALRILSVQERGAIARWNEKQERLGSMDFAVQEGDLIVQVGDDTEPESMDTLLSGASVRLHIERWPREVTVVLEKNSASEGFGVGWKCITGEDGDPVLRICYIGGVLEEWNDKARLADRPFEVVSLGSRINRVNGFGAVEDMLLVLQSKCRVEVAFERPLSWDRSNGVGLTP